MLQTHAIFAVFPLIVGRPPRSSSTTAACSQQIKLVTVRITRCSLACRQAPRSSSTMAAFHGKFCWCRGMSRCVPFICRQVTGHHGGYGPEGQYAVTTWCGLRLCIDDVMGVTGGAFSQQKCGIFRTPSTWTLSARVAGTRESDSQAFCHPDSFACVQRYRQRHRCNCHVRTTTTTTHDHQHRIAQRRRRQQH